MERRGVNAVTMFIDDEDGSGKLLSFGWWGLFGGGFGSAIPITPT